MSLPWEMKLYWWSWMRIKMMLKWTQEPAKTILCIHKVNRMKLCKFVISVIPKQGQGWNFKITWEFTPNVKSVQKCLSPTTSSMSTLKFTRKLCAQCCVEETMLTSHTASHSVADNYRLGLTKSKSKKTKTSLISDAPPKNLNGYHIFCREFREGKRNLFPQAKMIEINRLLRDDRHKLSPAEKAGYKPTNLHQLKPLLQSQCRSQDPFQLLQGQLLLFRQQHLLLLQ